MIIIIIYVNCVQMKELGKYFADIKFTLYGTSEAEPVPEACAQVTQEFFQENTFRLLIICLSKLDLEVSFVLPFTVMLPFLSTQKFSDFFFKFNASFFWIYILEDV